MIHTLTYYPYWHHPSLLPRFPELFPSFTLLVVLSNRPQQSWCLLLSIAFHAYELLVC